MRLLSYFIPLCFILITGCQRTPSISPAAEPTSRKAVAPMGSTTTNAFFIKKKLILAQLLSGKTEKEILKTSENQLLLNDLFTIFPKETLINASKKSKIGKKLLLAEFNFHERRFIEASLLLSEILDKAPQFPRARNLLARCFYFLGNPDRAQAELDFILTSKNTQAEEMLDAVFLMGAIALESPDTSKQMIQKGIRSWETYLKVAPPNELYDKVKINLKTLKEKLNENKNLNTSEKSILSDATSKKPDRKQAFEAFHADDLLLAEKKLKEILKLKRDDPEAQTFLARIFIRTNRIQEALKIFESVLKKHPTHMPALHYQGMAFIMSGNPQKAIESWQKIMQKDPEYASKYDLQARILVARGMSKQ